MPIVNRIALDAGFHLLARALHVIKCLLNQCNDDRSKTLSVSDLALIPEIQGVLDFRRIFQRPTAGFFVDFSGPKKKSGRCHPFCFPCNTPKRSPGSCRPPRGPSSATSPRTPTPPGSWIKTHSPVFTVHSKSLQSFKGSHAAPTLTCADVRFLRSTTSPTPTLMLPGRRIVGLSWVCGFKLNHYFSTKPQVLPGSQFWYF